MRRTAADNKYLHRDFHVSADLGVEYVGLHYGDNGVRDYLRRYALSYLKPLSEQIRAEGLSALVNYLETLYKAEEASDALHTSLNGNELSVSISYCPGVRYMKSVGHTPCKWHVQTISTVFETVADAAGIGFELLHYNEADGACQYRFFTLP